MSATRRTNGVGVSNTSETTASSSNSNMPATASIPPPTHSPYLPTRTEALFLAIYPVTLVLGAAFSHLSPTLYPPFNNSTYNVDAQSFQPAESAPSYFARKRNVFNTYFVKIGWFWCTLALFTFTLLSSRGRPARAKRSAGDTRVSDRDATTLRMEEDARLRRRWQTFLRWTVATTYWVLITQWCFGPPVIDRGFKLTGGACRLAAEEVNDAGSAIPGTEGAASGKALLTHAACTVAGGAWRGGHDISGHVFILVLGSGMLWLEILPFVLREWRGFGAARVVKNQQGLTTRVAALSDMDKSAAVGVPSALNAVQKEMKALSGNNAPSASAKVQIRAYATIMALVVAGFSWWMLLMTSAFFHTWLEKLTGFLCAFGALWTIFFAPRGLPWLREVLGMPGV